MKRKNPMKRIEKTVLTIPVIRPVRLIPLFVPLRRSAIAPVMIAGIPRRRPGPVSETIPRIIEVIARLLSDVAGAGFVVVVMPVLYRICIFYTNIL